MPPRPRPPRISTVFPSGAPWDIVERHGDISIAGIYRDIAFDPSVRENTGQRRQNPWKRIAGTHLLKKLLAFSITGLRVRANSRSTGRCSLGEEIFVTTDRRSLRQIEPIEIEQVSSFLTSGLNFLP